MDTHNQIEALLEKYWACETTIEEEKILRDFFHQNNSIPSHLQKYKPLFDYLAEPIEEKISTGFDEKIIAQIHRQSSKIKTIAILKVAASIVLLIGVGTSTVFFYNKEQKRQQYAQVNNARKTVLDALVMVSDNMKKGEKMVDNSFKYFDLLNKEDSTSNKRQK